MQNCTRALLHFCLAIKMRSFDIFEAVFAAGLFTFFCINGKAIVQQLRVGRWRLMLVPCTQPLLLKKIIKKVHTIPLSLVMQYKSRLNHCNLMSALHTRVNRLQRNAVQWKGNLNTEWKTDGLTQTPIRVKVSWLYCKKNVVVNPGMGL